jgi:hypothetical protein
MGHVFTKFAKFGDKDLGTVPIREFKSVKQAVTQQGVGGIFKLVGTHPHHISETYIYIYYTHTHTPCGHKHIL